MKIKKESGWFDTSPEAQANMNYYARVNYLNSAILALQDSPDQDIQLIVKQLYELKNTTEMQNKGG